MEKVNGLTAGRSKGGISVANEEHLALLKQVVDKRNAEERLSFIDLSGTDLSGADMRHVNLILADLSQANLSGAKLDRANLIGSKLTGANLSGAKLHQATLQFASLNDADLSSAGLHGTNLSAADLHGTDLSAADLLETIFGDVDLSGVIGLEACEHSGPSTVDFRTLEKSKSLPLTFLRGVGLPEALIDYLPTLLNQAIQYYSCFISYSAKDDVFAKRLFDDLQSRGVRCYFAKHDMPTGGKILDQIDAGIRRHDKVLLILSSHSIKSEWVEDEVTTAFAEERERGEIVLFPIRLDDSVMTTAEPWAAKLRQNRHIGDFTGWKEPKSYGEALKRLLRDLKVSKDERGD